MLFLENGHVSGFRTMSVGEGELASWAASTVTGKEGLGRTTRESPPIATAKELKTRRTITATAAPNAQRRLQLDATRSVGRMREALQGGIRVTGEAGLRCYFCFTWYRFGNANRIGYRIPE